MATDQKKCRRLNATLIFFDETGFLTQPYGQQSWGPIGRTPVIDHRLRHREKVTVLGSLTVSAARRRCGLYAEFLENRSVDQDDLIAHFGKLRRTFRTPLLVVLDNLNLHKGKQLRQWRETVGDVHFEFLPPYAPELNPAEGVWGHGKCVTAAGRLVEDVNELKQLAAEAIAAANQQSLLRAFIRNTRLPFRFKLARRKLQTYTQ